MRAHDSRRRRGILRSLAPLACLVWAAGAAWPAVPAAAGADDALNPIGAPKVLVFMFRYPRPPCPDETKGCPAAEYRTQITNPIMSAGQWSSLLNGQVRDFYNATSYGQTRPEFTVPANPARDDGWWTAPRDYQSYWNGKSAFHPDGGPAQGEDALADIVPKMLAAKALSATQFQQFSRFMIVTNAHYHGGVSTGRILSLFPTPFGTRAYTGTILDEEDAEDLAAEGHDQALVAIHELGHQLLGIPDNYGSCLGRETVDPVSPGCTGPWEVMGSRQELFSANARIRAGWIHTSTATGGALDPQESEITLPPLSEAPPTSKTAYELTPLGEQIPGVPNVLRIPFAKGPGFAGYVAECRRALPGDTPLPNEGLLLTKVIDPGRDGFHVLRPTRPADVSDAALRPGELFDSPAYGVRIRFTGYDGSNCRLTVDRVFGSPVPLVTVVDRPVAGDGTPEPAVALSPDIAGCPPVCHVPPWTLGPSGPFGTGGGPWAGHDNLVGVRVRNVGGAEARDVRVDVRARQPLRFEASCGRPTPSDPVGSATIESIAPGESAVAWVPWRPVRGSAGQLEATVVNPQGQPPEIDTVATTAFASRLLPAGGAGARRSTIAITVAAGRRCAHARSFDVSAQSQPRGWRVAVSPQSILVRPGRSRVVRVTVTARRRLKRAGARARIPLVVVERDPLPIGQADTGEPESSPVGAVELVTTVAARSSITLACPHGGRAGKPLAVTGQVRPRSMRGAVDVDYRPPAGTASIVSRHTRRGRFSATFAPDRAGRWRVQARARGDRRHRPSESRTCIVDIVPRNTEVQQAGA